ncbi:MAG: SPFH domain-containing protein [Candidatus Paceibacterota bacterium]
MENEEREIEKNENREEGKGNKREQKNSTLDVVLAVSFVGFTIAGGIFGIRIGFAGSWLAMFILLLLGGIILALSLKKIKVGHRAQYLFLGRRIQYFVKEGLHVVLWPFFTIKEIDCRAKTTTLNEENIFTSDNVEVKLEKPSIVSKIVDLNKYQDLDPENLPGLLDDVVDENVRYKIRNAPLEKVLGMRFSIDEEDIKHGLGNWGISIVRIIVPDVVPVNKDFIEAQELKTKESLQREGQRVQARHHADLIKFFSGSEQLGEEGPSGPELSPELAYEAALIHMDKAEKKKLASNNFGLDATTVDAIAKAVIRR